MDTARHRLTRLRRIALLCAVLLAAVTSLSAFLRHSAAGLGCQPWPACYAQGDRTAASGAGVPGATAIGAARLAHRITATLSLLGAIALAVLSMARTPMLRREAALSAALLALALALALLGVFTPGARVPAVAMANLLGGFVMLALAVRLAGPSSPVRLGPPAIAVVGLLLAQIASGALVSASHAGLACTDLAECAAQARAAGWDWPSLAPWREPAYAVGTPHADGALAQGLHRLGSFIVGVAVALLGMAALRRGRRREGTALLLLLAADVALGLVIGNSGLPLVPVLLHNLAAALMLALVVRLA
jgi:cytochrome c oxidase assembly protein subunit 15